MKKILIIVVMLLALTGCGKLGFEKIDYKTYREKINNKESFALFIGMQECNYCSDYKKTLRDMRKEYNFSIYYISTDDLNSEEMSALKMDIPFEGVPQTAFIEKGIEAKDKRIGGAQPYDYLVEKFKKEGIIND